MTMSRLAALAAVAVLLPGPMAAGATASGSLDRTFSGDGRAVLDLGVDASGQDVLVRRTGKVVVASAVRTATGAAFGVSQLRDDGTPDPHFHRTGTRVTRFTGQDVPRRVVNLGGRSLVAGSAGDDFGLAVYRGDGSLDPTFGTRGKVVTDVTPGFDQVRDLLVTRQGEVLAAGTAGDRFAVARYRADGTLDPTYGDGGVVLTATGFSGTATVLRLQPDGRLLVAGRSPTDAQQAWGVAVMRFALDGSVDETFGGGDGEVTTYSPENEVATAEAVAFDPDGRIVVAGGAFGPGDYSYFCLVRYLSDGTPDASFGGDGVVTTRFQPYYAHAYAVARQKDGTIVAAGRTDGEDHSDAMALIRYRPDGTRDTSFSGDGRAVVDVARRAAAAGTVATRNGTIVVAGTLTGLGGRSWPIVARFLG